MNNDDEKKELEENKEEQESNDNLNNDSKDSNDSNDEEIRELLDSIRDLTDDLIESGTTNEGDKNKLVNLSQKFVSKIKKKTIIIGLILFPICSLLFLALSGIINWIEYDNILVVIGLFIGMAFLDNLFCTLIKLFLYKAYLFSFGGMRQLILIGIFLLVYFLSGYLGLRIVGIWPMILVFELYALIKGIIGFIIDSFIIKKKS